MNDILNISSKNSYLTTRQWEEIKEYVKNRKSITEDTTIKETDDVIEEEIQVKQSEAYEQMIVATSVSDMYMLLLSIINENPEKLYEISSDELQILYNAANRMNEEDSSEDYQDLADTLQYIAGDYDLNGAAILADATWSAKTYSSNATENISGNITLSGTIIVKSGVTLKIFGSGVIKRANTFTGDMFVVEEGGTLHINGGSDTTGIWNEKSIILDGNIDVVATGQIIDCSGKLSLRDAVIRNNRGQTGLWLGGSGAGNYTDQYHQTTVEITRTKIENCDCSSAGGIAIANSTPSDYSIDIWDSMICDCTAVDASAIYLKGDGQASIIIRNSVIDGCDTYAGANESYGGCIRTNGGGRFKLTMQNSILRNCDGWRFGGGIYWNANGNGAKLTITDCQFLNNSAVDMGGAMFIEGQGVVVNATTNKAVSPAITEGMPGDIVGTLFYGNRAANGACISFKSYSNTNEIQISNTEMNFGENVIFDNNIATNGAAVAYNLHDTHNYPNGAKFTFNIDGAQFINNISEDNGGAIFIDKQREDYVCAVNFNSGTISNNTAKNGGALYIQNGDFNMNNGILDNNTSEASGGAVYVTGGNVNINSGTISNNIALDKGGAIAVTSGNVTIGIEECHDAGEYSTHIHPIIESNIASDGGGIYVDGGATTMWCGNIKHNLTHDKTVNVLVVSGGNFIYNGGIIGIPYDTGVFVNGGIFDDNSSESEKALKHELHYHSVLGEEAHNGRIPESKWIASPRGDILHKEYCDDETPTWADLFPEYEFVGWESHDDNTEETVNLYALWEKK